MEYADTVIEVAGGVLTIRDYYFPGIDRRIPLSEIRAVVERSDHRWRGRIMGTGDFRHWANLDTKRPHKTTAFVLDIGRHWRPVITPDRPEEAFAALTLGNGQI